jgi:hypothetical protein
MGAGQITVQADFPFGRIPQAQASGCVRQAEKGPAQTRAQMILQLAGGQFPLMDQSVQDTPFVCGRTVFRILEGHAFQRAWRRWMASSA